jgi:hypothetical protein
MIRGYFWDKIVGELYENTLRIMKEANLLEEARASFETSYKIERTAELIIENGVLYDLSPNKKKELTREIIEMCFYPTSFAENHQTTLDAFLEENWARNTQAWFGDRIRDAARFIKGLYTILVFLLISPATFAIGKTTSAAGDKIYKAVYGEENPNYGMDPSMRKFWDFVDSVSPVKHIFTFLNKDLVDISKYLLKVNNLEDNYIQSVLRDSGANPRLIVKKCWDKNKFQMSGEDKTLLDQFFHFVSGKGLSNLLRNPQRINAAEIAYVLKSDSANPQFQKMFYDFRVCVYDKLFEIILGFARTIYSLDDASYEIIKFANEAHKQKNFKKFFDLRPKQQNEEAMFRIMKVLVALDDIANQLEKRKGELVADKYIDKFVDYLRLNIEHTYKELETMANQYKYNEDRYKEIEPDDEAKAEAIQKERFNAKKSIFED